MVVRMNQNSEVAARKTKTMTWKKLKRSEELTGTEELSDNSLNLSLSNTSYITCNHLLGKYRKFFYKPD